MSMSSLRRNKILTQNLFSYLFYFTANRSVDTSFRKKNDICKKLSYNFLMIDSVQDKQHSYSVNKTKQWGSPIINRNGLNPVWHTQTHMDNTRANNSKQCSLNQFLYITVLHTDTLPPTENLTHKLQLGYNNGLSHLEKEEK